MTEPQQLLTRLCQPLEGEFWMADDGVGGDGGGGDGCGGGCKYSSLMCCQSWSQFM